jgi:hypothetical protein
LISFGLGVSPLSPLMLRETSDNGLSSIIESIPGGLGAERSRFSDDIPRRTLLRFVLLLSARSGVVVCLWRSQDCKV